MAKTSSVVRETQFQTVPMPPIFFKRMVNPNAQPVAPPRL